MIPNGNGNPFPPDDDDDEPSAGDPSPEGEERAEAELGAPAESTPIEPEPEPEPAPDLRAYVQLQPAPRPRPSRARGLAAGALLAVLFGMFLLLSWDRGGGVRERTVPTGDASASAKIVQIDVTGVIARGSVGLLGGPSVDVVARTERQLRAAEKDADVKAVLLRIDSPGGTVTASDELWHAVTQFKARSKKPVVVHMGGMCTSGGYYLAVAADALVCEPTTITGSIGVILQGYNAHALLKEHGVKDVSITSGPNKDLLNPTAPPRPKHREIVQGMVDAAHARFVELVAKGRGLPLADAKRLADGRIYTPGQALAEKLVDQIGYHDVAFAKAKELAGLEEARLVRYQRKGKSLFDLLTGAAPAPAPELSPARLAASLVEELRTPRLLALWRPTTR